MDDLGTATDRVNPEQALDILVIKEGVIIDCHALPDGKHRSLNVTVDGITMLRVRVRHDQMIDVRLDKDDQFDKIYIKTDR